MHTPGEVAGGDSLEPGALTRPVFRELEFGDPAEPPPVRFKVQGCLRATP